MMVDALIKKSLKFGLIFVVVGTLINTIPDLLQSIGDAVPALLIPMVTISVIWFIPMIILNSVISIVLELIAAITGTPLEIFTSCNMFCIPTTTGVVLFYGFIGILVGTTIAIYQNRKSNNTETKTKIS